MFLVPFQEYDIGNDNVKNPKERLARQKQNLRRRLGMYLAMLVDILYYSNNVCRFLLGINKKHEVQLNNRAGEH